MGCWNWHRVATLLATGAMVMVGCAMEVGDEADAARAEEELIRPRRETPSVLTLYSEAGLWGDLMSVSVTPPDPYEHVRLITKTQVESANLLQRISSLRLTCGSRGAQVVLFGTWNTSSSLSQWSESAVGDLYYCAPGQTVDVDLHAEGSELADRVASVHFLVHARDMREISFSSLVRGAWTAGLDDLPDGAEARGGPRLRMTSNYTFRLRQDLQLDHWSCGDRAGHFELQATLHQEGYFSAIVTDTYVDTGWGDAWGCRERMRDELRAGAVDAARRLEAGLDDLLAVTGDPPRRYFAPLGTLREFYMGYGGESGGLLDDVLAPVEVAAARGI